MYMPISSGRCLLARCWYLYVAGVERLRPGSYGIIPYAGLMCGQRHIYSRSSGPLARAKRHGLYRAACMDHGGTAASAPITGPGWAGIVALRPLDQPAKQCGRRKHLMLQVYSPPLGKPCSRLPLPLPTSCPPPAVGSCAAWRSASTWTPCVCTSGPPRRCCSQPSPLDWWCYWGAHRR